MFRVLWLAVFVVGAAAAGTISGELIYPPDGLGAYAVVALGPEELAAIAAGDSIDFASLPMATLFMPGPYSIDGDFTDGLPYVVYGVKVTDPFDPAPASGDPMGMHPEDVYTFGGNASGVDVELDTVGTIGGHITYGGDVSCVKVNVYDIMSGSPVFEGVYVAGAHDYAIVVPSGFKTLEFFADLNGNDVWEPELLEPGVYYTSVDTSGWGPVVFAGGGDRFATGVDVYIPPARVDDAPEALAPALRCKPNPFRFRSKMTYFAPAPGRVELWDLSGRLILARTVAGEGAVELPRSLPAGVLVGVLRCGNQTATTRIVHIR